MKTVCVAHKTSLFSWTKWKEEKWIASRETEEMAEWNEARKK